jgi:hypothetical protein
VITTQVLLDIRTTDGSAIDISGAAVFYLVRGHSAVIPADLGAGPDSTRWYIRRWEDQTVQPTAPVVQGFRAQPSSSRTWGQIKALYLDPMPVAPPGSTQRRGTGASVTR